MAKADKSRWEDDEADENKEQKQLYTRCDIEGIPAMQWTILVCDMQGRFHTLRRILFKEISIILIDGEPRDHNADPYYNDKQ